MRPFTLRHFNWNNHWQTGLHNALTCSRGGQSCRLPAAACTSTASSTAAGSLAVPTAPPLRRSSRAQPRRAARLIPRSGWGALGAYGWS